jgi:DNA repair exonuclease SbcCD ATPase subunit
MQASTVKRELEQEAEKASKAATAAAKDAEIARARIDGELQAAKKILDGFAQVTGTASEIERLAGEVARLSPIALDLAQRLARAEAETTELERLATGDERAVRDLRENIVATQFFNGLKPVCCPRCETRVSNERLKRESADLSCSLCAEEIPIDEMEGADDGLDAIEQRFAAAKAAADRARANTNALSVKSKSSSDELENARRELTKAATSATFEERRKAELDVARLEGALKERQTPARPVIVSSDVTLINAAHAEADKAYNAGRGDILERLNTEILALGQRLGVQMLEEVKLNTNASLRLTKGGESTSFSKVTAGERLRLRIATAVALIRVGQERGLGRHPGLLIVDSPAAEEVSPDDLTAVLRELQAISRETVGLQIIIGSANASAIVDQLGEQWCRSATGDDYLW